MTLDATPAEITAWQAQIEEESVGWIRDVKRATPDQVEAYRAGLQQGAGALLAKLRERERVSRLTTQQEADDR